jgi:hypothetical protein
MSFRDTMLPGWIFRRPLERTECSLSGYAPLQLPLDFFRAALFERISTAARDQHPCDHEQHRHALHLLILRTKVYFARELRQGFNSSTRHD